MLYAILIKNSIKVGEFMKKSLHITKNSIPEKVRVELISMLNASLASITDLYAQLKQAHWNVKGPEFISLHKLFDEVAEELEEYIDTVAERAAALGGTVLGTLHESVKNTALDPYPTNIVKAKDHLEHLTHNIAIIGELTREYMDASEELNDMATNDVFIDLARFLDQKLWFLESHLQK